MNIFLVRHGESQGNLEQRFIGANSPHGLTETGQKQSKNAARILSSYDLGNAKIYSSPAIRAVETVEIISERLGIYYTIEERLTEINLGEMEDMLKSDVEKKYKDVIKNFSEKPSLCEIPGGESIPEVQQRILSFIYDKVDEGHDLILISHDVAIRAFLVYAMNMSVDFIWSLSVDELASGEQAKFVYGDRDVPLGSVSLVKYANGEYEVKKIGLI